MSEEEKRGTEPLKDKAKMAAVGVVAAVSVAIGGAFDNPADLVRKEEVLFPPAIVQTLVEEQNDDEPEREDEQDDEASSALSLKERFRQAVLRLPRPVRAVLGVPLWGIGWLLDRAASLLWGLVLSPLLRHLLRVVFFAAVLLGVLALLLKLLFPDIPWKKLLNKKTILAALIFAAVLELADVLVPLFWKDWTRWSNLFRFLTSAAFLAAAALRLSRVLKKLSHPIKEAVPAG